MQIHGDIGPQVTALCIQMQTKDLGAMIDEVTLPHEAEIATTIFELYLSMQQMVRLVNLLWDVIKVYWMATDIIANLNKNIKLLNSAVYCQNETPALLLILKRNSSWQGSFEQCDHSPYSAVYSTVLNGLSGTVPYTINTIMTADISLSLSMWIYYMHIIWIGNSVVPVRWS